MMGRREIASQNTFLPIAVLIVLIAFTFRIADLKTIPPGLHYDDGRYITRAWRIAQGYGLELNFQDIPEPFDQYIRAGFMRLAGGVLPFVDETFSVLLNTLAVAVTMAAARLLYRSHPRREVIALAAGVTLATLPPAVIISRNVYRANWEPLLTMLALFSLLWAWHKQRQRSFAAAGMFSGMAASFYLGGLFFPPAMILALLTAGFRRALRSRAQCRNLLLMLAVFAVTMLPWLYFFLRVPGWLNGRVAMLAETDSPLSNLSLLPRAALIAVGSLMIPEYHHDYRYNTLGVAALNPLLVILFVVGMILSLRYWRRPWSLAALLIVGVMLGVNILSSEPEQPVRWVGLFGALAIVVGFGAGEILRLAARWPRLWQTAAHEALLLTLILTPLFTAYQVWYHFKASPAMTDPDFADGWALIYRLGFADILQSLPDSPQPVYLPVEYLNSDLAVALLRTRAFPTVRIYDGRPLPEGIVVLPKSTRAYGLLPLLYTPAQYALALPQSGEILILPPLSPGDAQALSDQIHQGGQPFISGRGLDVGKTLPVTAEENPFSASAVNFRQMSPQSSGVYDGNLELVGVDEPSSLTPGEWAQVTLYWRIRQTTGQYYYSRIQSWNYADSSEGTQSDSADVLFDYLYPTVMWTPGEIVPEVRYVRVFRDAPAGGYRFALAVYTYPGPTPVTFTLTPGAAGKFDDWMLIGRSAVSPENYVSAPDVRAAPEDAVLDDSIKLTGVIFDPPLAALNPGNTLHMRLNWQVVKPVAESYTVFVHLSGADGRVAAQDDVVPFDGQFPTWAWPPGSTITTDYSLTVPDGASGPFSVVAGMYSYPSLQRLPVAQDGTPSPDSLIVLK
jgi:dolichyl-phosphate-mannose-protein mannosyltransferase